MSRSLRAHLLLVVVALLWGATFVLVKNALADISPLLFNFVRMLVAFACMGAVYWRHFGRLKARALWSGAAVGLFLAIGYQFQTAGLARTTPSKSAFITGLVVVLVPLLASVPALRARGSRPPRWNAFLAAVVAFAGILLLTSPPRSATASRHGVSGKGIGQASVTAEAVQAAAIHEQSFQHRGLSFINTGDLLTLGCAIGFALHCVFLSRATERVPFEQLALLQIGFATLFIAITTPMFEHPWMHLSTRLTVAIALTGVLGTAAAFSIQSWAQQFLPAAHTVLILSMEPVFAAITSFIFLGERLGVRAGSGALLVLAAIALTELVPSTPLPTAHEAVTSSSLL